MSNAVISDLKDTWDKQYEGENVTALKDVHLYQIETNAILNELSKHLDNVSTINILEIGCGTGELLRNVSCFLDAKGITYSLTGVDFSENAISLAKSMSPEGFNFYQSDFISFFREINKNKFDIILSQRSIMALMDLDSQMCLLREMKNCMNEGGVGIVSECFSEALSNFNQYRLEAGLDEIQKVWHSRYLDEQMFQSMFSVSSFYHFCSTYMLTTRILYPMFEEPKHNQKVHEFGSKLPETGDFSFLKMAVFKK
jgi:SAM-dependent methyltransferase